MSIPDVVSDHCEEKYEKKVTGRSNAIMSFYSKHPLSGSHGVKYIVNNAARVPNIVGANLPRCDKGDREYYCRTMLVLFKPWRQGTDLKAADQLWEEIFKTTLSLKNRCGTCVTSMFVMNASTRGMIIELR
jgi:hypothetical protein